MKITLIITLSLFAVVLIATITKLGKEIQFRNCIIMETIKKERRADSSIVFWCQIWSHGNEYKNL